MVYRVFSEKKQGHNFEAAALCSDLVSYLNIPAITKVRIINRYDVDNISEELFTSCCTTVFSEPPVDTISTELTLDTPNVFAVEYLPGQFDQRADSAAQCIQIISCGERPTVRSAKVYMIYGEVSADEMTAIKKYVINPVEAREASLEKPETLEQHYDIPETVPVLEGFIDYSAEQLGEMIKSYGLAMDIDDITFLQSYFKSEHRNPTLTEVRVLDTYWSDHCRHTTFLTSIDNVTVDDPEVTKAYEDYLKIRKELGRENKPVTLMDIATIGARYLKKTGKLDKLDESEEINACTVKITVNVDSKPENWLLLFKNETHNHPTEIEPFGGAATCIGGAIRDPLSGRSYVYAAMRITGAADPLTSLKDTIPGKLPQKKLTTTAAAGYSSYGNQIGLATGIVDELYHPGYAAKRMEIGAVIAAAPEENVIRLTPDPDDIVILIGGRTGRDGCGGATGSSKAHNAGSLSTCGAEVQKGNAPEERKLQRLFRNPEASKLIKRCNDFGAGGVSVAIGELADGLDINLDLVPKKYAGLDGTELAISESQERMAVVVAPADADKFLDFCRMENLEATIVAKVTESPRLVMHWNGATVVDISREFLNSNGAEKHVDAILPECNDFNSCYLSGKITDNMSLEEAYTLLAGDLNVCSKQGLSERFDSTIGADTVLMPFGGRNQLTPIQSMVHTVSVEKGHTDTCSFMSWGFNPYITSASPFHGAYLAVVESICKLIAAGAEYSDIYLTFQEYFEKPSKKPERFGKPFAALLGAMEAQLDYNAAAIGGKDSMSGSFENINVPPTLCSFAVTTGKNSDVISPEFKHTSSNVYLITPEYSGKLPKADSLKAVFAYLHELNANKQLLASYTPGFGGVAEAVMKMCLGNSIGFEYDSAITKKDIFSYSYASFIIETDCELKDFEAKLGGATVKKLGTTVVATFIRLGNEVIDLDALADVYNQKLEPVFATKAKVPADTKAENFSFMNNEAPAKAPAVITAAPKVLIPVFPGTNCEYDSAKAFRDAGADAEIFVIRNLSSKDIQDSADLFAQKVKESQMIFIPGGFSGADEPDGSAKFITAFFRNAKISEAVTDLLDERKGLMSGICNGFQALIKLGLLPYGRITEADSDSATLTFNSIARHQSKIVRTRICSTKSPWLTKVNVGEVYKVPISHGEGRFIATEEMIRELAANGQIATQYVDLSGNASMDILYNPNHSMYAIEGITSKDGRVFGKMGHSERIGAGLYQNVEGQYDIKMFSSAVEYFK